MIRGIGTDIIDVDRIKEAMMRHDNFLTRNFTVRENEYFASKNFVPETVAGSFSAKEAFSKAMGTGVRGFSLIDVEVLRKDSGKPYICFKGSEINCEVSISHTKNQAIATVALNSAGIAAVRNNILCEDSYTTFEYVRNILPLRSVNVNKTDCGRVFVVAGSKGMTGAAVLCANAALRCGAGLVTVGTPRSEQPIIAMKLTEAMTVALDGRYGVLLFSAKHQVLKQIDKSDVCVFGMGLGRSIGVAEITEDIILKSNRPLIIDADGINALSENINILYKKNNDIILTPHTGEMSRLTGLPAEYINQNREHVACEFAMKYKVTLVLKGKDTIIATEAGRAYTNPTGNAGMATAGCGDVLAGIIGAFLGQGLKSVDAAVLGVYLHGFAGDIAKEEKGELGLIASDIIEYLPSATQAMMMGG